MYYEEKVIDGVLHWRGTPTGKWVQCTPERSASAPQLIRSALYCYQCMQHELLGFCAT